MPLRGVRRTARAGRSAVLFISEPCGTGDGLFVRRIQATEAEKIIYMFTQWIIRNVLQRISSRSGQVAGMAQVGMTYPRFRRRIPLINGPRERMSVLLP